MTRLSVQLNPHGSAYLDRITRSLFPAGESVHDHRDLTIQARHGAVSSDAAHRIVSSDAPHRTVSSDAPHHTVSSDATHRTVSFVER